MATLIYSLASFSRVSRDDDDDDDELISFDSIIFLHCKKRGALIAFFTLAWLLSIHLL